MCDDVAMQGKVVLVTGANTGIGEVTARELAGAGAKVWLACRNEGRAREAMARIRDVHPDADLHFLALDLGDLGSVRIAADAFLESEERLDVLINNAGLAGQRGQTAQGFEIAFGVNHLGHFLFTEQLTPLLVKSGTDADPSRIVIVASRAHTRVPPKKGIDWEALEKPTKTVSGFPEYSVSKLANVLHAKALARRLEGKPVRVYSLHPGVVASDVWRKVPWPFRSIMKLFMITNEEGAQTTLHCATSPSVIGESGRYYDKSAPAEATALARDEALQEELWRRSEQWIAPRS